MPVWVQFPPPELDLRRILEAVVIKLVLLRGEAKQVLALVSDPLPRTFAPEPRQVPFKGPQCLLPQISLLLYGHRAVPVLVVHRWSEWNADIPILSAAHLNDP